MIDDLPHATYWKNGVSREIREGIYSTVTCIDVYHNDLYVVAPGAGIQVSYDYWKEDTGIVLPDVPSPGHTARALTIAGDDIYVTGTGGEYPDLNKGVIYWKNSDTGVHLVPHEVTIHQSSGLAIGVSKGDVIIAGYLDFNATEWKNGKATELPMPNDQRFLGTHSVANGVATSGGNVYISGTANLTAQYITSSESIAIYWKNGIPIMLTKDSGSVATAIAVDGDDMYVAGVIFSADGSPRAAYWKNGNLFVLGGEYSIANAIAVDGQDVFVAGNVNDYEATYGENGKPTTLGARDANTIFVAAK